MLRGAPSRLDVNFTEASLQPVLIAAGTTITCELGHAICVTASDLHVNEPLSVEMFTRWRSVAPRPGDTFPSCSICGAAAHKEGANGVELHTAEGWRSLKGTPAAGLATRADIDGAVALVEAKITAMTHRLEAALWKHTLGILLNVLVIGGLLIWFFR